MEEETTILDRLDYSNIVLIKKEGATTIGDYRLIALLNSSVKIISKIHANRLN